jgi:K+-sensing histidine kinase KdpD
VPLERIDTGRYLRDLDFLLSVTRETLSSLQLGTLLRRVVHLMRDRFGYDCAAVALVEEDTVVFRAGSGGDLDAYFEESGNQPGWRVAVGKGIVGKVVASGQPRLVNDVLKEPDYIEVDFLKKTRAELTVPLVHRDKALGVLDVQSHRVDAFGETDVRLLEIVGALVAPAVHIASLYERERQRSRHLHLVNEISRLVMSSLDRETVITVACEAILEALDISFAGIALLDRTGLRIAHGGHASRLTDLPESELQLSLGSGLVGHVIATGETLRVSSSTEHTTFQLVPRMESALCVPLRVRNKIIGAVDVEHAEREHFSDEDERLLENVSAYLSQAMENAQLFENQRRRWQQLLVINEAARIATESFDLEAILKQVAQEVHDRFGHFAVGVMLCDERDVVMRALSCDEALALAVGHRVRVGEGLAGRAAASGEVVQADGPERFEAADALRADIQSILCVPLRVPSGVIGVLQVQSTDRDAFSSDDRLVMGTLAQSVAGAIANARSIRQTEQLREDLTRMIVHDLRNPVQAVLLTLQEVARAAEGKLPGNVTDSLRDGVTCTEDILEMVNSLLDVARFEAGKQQLRLAPAALNDHVRGVVRRFAPFARSKGIQITTVLSQDVPVLRFDHELVNRALANLIGNAMKFTPEGARVTIRTELASEPRPELEGELPQVVVAVQDTGEGIPPEYHNKIFEKFGQVESRKAGLKMSTGLGLALCRYVVEAHGGRIWVESTPGKGSTFFFSLRVPKREAPSEGEPRGKRQSKKHDVVKR